MTRACTVCKRELPLEQFYRQKHGKYGRTSQCKSCRFTLYEQPKTHVKVCRVCGNREVHRRPKWCLKCDTAKASKWYRANKEKARKRRLKWVKAHPEVNKRAFKERYEWLKLGDVTKLQLEEIYRMADGKCYYCGKAVKARLTPYDPRGFDHVVARCNGGRHTASNMVVSCMSCNANKAVEDTVGAISRRPALFRLSPEFRRAEADLARGKRE